MFKTRVTEILGCQFPIQCGTMQWLSRAELVSAVVNAGAFACIPAATFPTRQELLDEIKKIKGMTDKPFGVNVSLFPSLMPRPADELIQTVIDGGVKVLETAGRSPEPYRKQIKDAGLIHIHKCARVRDAVKADSIGVDIVSIVGTECGGHPSMEGVTTMVLIPQAVDAIKVPLIAGGGICDGRSMMAALALGAEGVNMGTRFIATKECQVADLFKEKIIAAAETDTMLVMESLKNPARVIRNAWATKIREMEDRGASLEELAPLISGHVSRKGWSEGSFDEGMFPCGQAIGRIKDKPAVAELIRCIIDQAKGVERRFAAMH